MKIIKYFLRSFLTILIAFIAFPYLISPVYRFPEPIPFSGKGYYNPYKNLNESVLCKANFHCHSNSWGLLTDGRSGENDAERITKEYSNYGYKVIGISDYMSINPSSSFPEYEHGMGIKKTHQVVVGAGSVLWLDFFFPHTISNKQFMLNMLKDSSNLIMLSHPSWNNAYTADDIKLLGNYDCMEILSTNRESVALWDTSLSAGKPVFMMVNDDGHNAANPEVTGRIFNIIYSDSDTPESCLVSLKNGRNVGYEIPISGSVETQKQYHEDVVLLKSHEISNDSLHVVFSDSLSSVKLIGQGGVLLAKKDKSDNIDFPLALSKGYIRCEAQMYNGTRIFMNPVIFSDNITGKGSPDVNVLITVVQLTAFWLLFIVIIWLLWRPCKRKN